MQTDLFDFHLPEDLIALRPTHPRDAARMLVVRQGRGKPADKAITDLPALLMPGDALVLNDTRVIPGALKGLRARGGVEAQISATLIEKLDDRRWQALVRPAKRLALGDRIRFGGSRNPGGSLKLDASVEARGEDGVVTLTFDLCGEALHDAIEKKGAMPLPPYIASRRAADDLDRTDYQTTFARNEGAVAAPTAGLHFTPALMAALEERGVTCHFVTLHVGPGTFLPVRATDTENHKMHAERGVVTPETVQALNAVKMQGGRVVAVGTTALRLLESASNERGRLGAFTGGTDIFITPGYHFKFVDQLVTNFHLPRSTLFMLVAAFSGLDTMKQAYAHAIEQRYRFYSYGDACLLMRAQPA